MKTRSMVWMIVLLVHQSAQAEDRYVNLANPTPSAPYTSWATAANDIQTAVDAAMPWDTVWVTNGHYMITSEISITKEIDIRSVNGAGVTIIDAQSNSRCLNLETMMCFVTGFTFTNGYAAYGGGVYCAVAEQQQLIIDCVISGNQATAFGGGMYNGLAARCTISNNSAGFWGGGVSGVNVNSCTINNNSAPQGGGVYRGSTYACVISNNSAELGGGMYQGWAFNSVFSHNTATNGGGIYQGNATSCTISDNSSSLAGGGMYEGAAINSIIYFNSGGEGYNNLSSNSTARGSCTPSQVAGVTNCINANPLFVDRANRNYRLLAESPCIDAGITAFVSSSTDLEGNPRIFNEDVDMGAYEFQGVVPDPAYEAWKTLFFTGNALTNPLISGSAADPDEDGQNNFAEYTAGMIPTNPASFFAITNYQSSSSFVLEWPSVTGRWYAVLWTPTLTNAFQSLENFIEDPRNSYTDILHNVEAGGFYKVDVRLKE